MERKNGIFYTTAINLCLDYHLTGNGPQTPGPKGRGGHIVELDKYGLPAWMGLDCDVRGLRPPYRVGLCKVDGMSVVKQTRTDSPKVPNVYNVKMRCRGKQELEEWPSAKFAVESGIISSAEPPQHPSSDRPFGSWSCVEIKFRTPHAIDATSCPQLHLLDDVEILLHRRDVVQITAADRWRRGSRRSPQ